MPNTIGEPFFEQYNVMTSRLKRFNIYTFNVLNAFYLHCIFFMELFEHDNVTKNVTFVLKTTSGK